MFSALTQATGSTSLQTRKVLIIINLQNDSLLSSGGIQVTATHDFVGKIKAIVPHFRSIGDIIWVRTEITRKPGPVSPNPEQVEAAADQAHEKNKKAREAEEQNLADDTSSIESGRDMQFYHPSSRVKARMKKSSPATRLDQRSADLEAFDDDYVPFEDIMTKPRKGIEPTFFVGGTHGAELADEILPVVDPHTDMILTKHYYSAFDQTPLLMTLRMKLVTEVYLCGCLTNVGIYATAADAVQHGMGVTVIEDCLGYRSEDKHVEAMRQMADIMGVNGVDSEEIIETSGGIAPPDAESPIFTGPGVEGITMTSLSLTGSRTPSVESAHPPHTHNPEGLLTDAQQPTIKVDKRTSSAIGERSEAVTPTPELHTAAKSVSSQSKGGTPGASKRASLMKNRDSGLINARTLGPQDSIGAGDSRIIHDILEPGLAKDAFEQLKEEVQWQTMSHRSGQVPRLVAVQGEVGKNGEIPIYRHPADESPPLHPFTTCVGKIRKELEQSLQQPFNHVLIQLYRDGNDNISEHSDKTLDIVRDSAIVNMSIGAQRVMTLRTKKSNRTSGVDSPTTSRQTQKIPMPHNSVFVLGSNTNMHWLHGVRADKRPIQQKSAEEMSFGGERISLTFRQIGTFTNSNNKKIWGQGARKKSPSSAGRVRTGDDEEMEAMVMAFGKENHQIDFDWQAEYGQGFDVIHLVSAAKPKLSLCRHKIANLRVQLSLLEKNLPYDVVEDKNNNKPAASTNEESSEQRRHRSLPWSHGLSNIEKPTFKDTDEDASETVGDLAILFYLEKLYPFEPAAAAEGPDARDPKAIINKRTYSRAAQSNELLFAWQNLPSITSSAASSSAQQPSSSSDRPDNNNNNNADALFTKDLDVWESYAREKNHTPQEGFIAAPHWTLIDCAFWPVLNEIVHSWSGFRVGRFPALSAYHERVLSRGGVQELVEMGD
ncbi:hypothetical protein XANCAGTX0491_004095 [Xanthoria calcicola]